MPIMTAAQMNALAKGKKPNGKSPAPVRAPPLRPIKQEVTASPRLATKKEEVEDEGPYTEYRLVSSGAGPWKHNVMTFKSMNRSSVDVPLFAQPVKLNRKEPKSRLAEIGEVDGPAQPMMVDGRPVMHDQEVVMLVSVDGVQHTEAKAARLREAAATKKNGKAPAPDPKKKSFAFKKKTRQIFTTSDATRQLRKEERYPWYLEDDAEEAWVGKMNDTNKDGIYAIFKDNNGAFEFIPTHRMYDFVPAKRHVASMTSEEVDAKVARSLNNNSLSVQMTRRNPNASAATLATINAAENLRGSPAVKTEDTDGIFGGDEDVKKEQLGAEGDFDEIDFEDDVADDEDTMNPDETMDDEDTRETKERIKREQVDSHVDENEGEEEDPALKGEGKKIKKALMELDKNDAYDSDDEDRKNPYASSDEEEEEEIPEVPASLSLPTPPPTQSNGSGSRSTTPKPKGKAAATSTIKSQGRTSAPPSRGASPANVASSSTARSSGPTHGAGAALLAKRATSPSARHSNAASRAVSPRAASPLSRAASPSNTGASRATSPAASSSSSHPNKNKNKRKADAENASGTPTSPIAESSTAQKKPKVAPASSPSSAAEAESFPGMLDEREIIEFIREHPGIFSSEVVAFYKKQGVLADPRNQNKLTAIIRKTCNFFKEDGKTKISLKEGY